MSLMEVMGQVRQTKRIEYRHLPQAVVNASVSLIFGTSLGPEVAIMDLAGGLSTWVGDRLRVPPYSRYSMSSTS